MILEQLKVLKENNIKGRILTSNYQMFNKPEVYHRLLKFEHLEGSVYTEEIHHTKRYIFHKENHKTVMIRSSNLTKGALKVNREWNLKIEKAEHIEMIQKLMEEFEDMWHKAEILDHAWILSYEESYKNAQILRENLKKLKLRKRKLSPIKCKWKRSKT